MFYLVFLKFQDFPGMHMAAWKSYIFVLLQAVHLELTGTFPIKFQGIHIALSGDGFRFFLKLEMNHNGNIAMLRKLS